MNLDDCRAFIFDMDGVVVDSEDLYKIIEKELFEEVGVWISQDEHVTFQGCSYPVIWSRIKERYGVSRSLEELVEMTEEKVIRRFSSMQVIQPMPGIVDLLTWLKAKGIKLALASSSTIDVINIILAKTGLEPFFEVVVDCIEAGAGKPDPAIFLLAQKKLGVSKENCVVIEDSKNGIRAALAAGIFCIAFNGPGSEHQDQSAASWRITRFAEIVEKLNQEVSGI